MAVTLGRPPLLTCGQEVAGAVPAAITTLPPAATAAGVHSGPLGAAGAGACQVRSGVLTVGTGVAAPSVLVTVVVPTAADVLAAVAQPAVPTAGAVSAAALGQLPRGPAAVAD